MQRLPPRLLLMLLALLWSAFTFPEFSCGEEWRVPFAGNAYRTAPEAGGRAVRRDGSLRWNDPAEVHSTFFRVDRAAKLGISIEGRGDTNTSALSIRVGSQEFELKPDEGKGSPMHLGEFDVAGAGYVRVDIQGIDPNGEGFAAGKGLSVASDTEGLKLDYVKSNEGNMFYWGRRGPSVHLRYEVPRRVTLQYAYSEITVPRGEDPIGTFYMANGFGEGYFGFQVNSSTERRVLFSVWSPFKTDNPSDIPEDQRINTVARGPEVHVGKFGNEGSGGQSYLVYPWTAGETYRFLTEVKPDGKGNTNYTSWFGEKSSGDWRLIASFRRPKTDTHLRGFHSFLESFSPSYGYVGRRGQYGNVWVVDTEGEWHECVRARFSVDPTGGGRHRLDYAGGAEGDHFFLRNCGFFKETGTPGETFTRATSASQQPQVDLQELPR